MSQHKEGIPEQEAKQSNPRQVSPDVDSLVVDHKQATESSPLQNPAGRVELDSVACDDVVVVAHVLCLGTKDTYTCHFRVTNADFPMLITKSKDFSEALLGPLGGP